MDFFVWQRTVVDEAGNVLPSASVSVTDVVSGSLVQLYSDEGVSAVGNPITADSSGFVQFYIKAGIYDIVASKDGNTRTWDDEAIGAPIKKTPAEVSAGVDVVDYRYPELTPERYGDNENPGTTDMADAILAAIAVAKEYSDGATVQCLNRAYLATKTITFDGDRIGIKGKGRNATQLWFAPTANDTFIEFSTGAAQQEGPHIEDLSILSADDTYTKVAIDTSDGSRFRMSNVEIAGTVDAGGTSSWSGGDSVGLRINGREFGMIRDIYIAADRPIVARSNPNHNINLDSFNFHNTYLIAWGNPIVEFEDEVQPRETSFTGSNAWVRGIEAFKWNPTTLTEIASSLAFENVNTEQGESSSAYSFDIQAPASPTCRSIIFRNFYSDPGRNGIKLRNVEQCSLSDCQLTGQSGRTNLDITFISQTQLELRNTLIPDASSVTLTKAVLVDGSPFNASETIVPKTVLYRYDEDAVISQKPALGYNSLKIWSYTGTLAHNATLNTPITRAAYTAAIVKVSAYSATGPIHCGGSAVWTKDGSTTKIGGTSNFVAAASGTELRCIDGGSGLVIINTLGQTVTLAIDVEFV